MTFNLQGLLGKRAIFLSGLSVAVLALVVVAVVGKHKTFAGIWGDYGQYGWATAAQTAAGYQCQTYSGSPQSSGASTYNFTAPTTQTTYPGYPSTGGYVYSFGDGSPSINMSEGSTPVSHTYATPGTYTASVTMYPSGYGQNTQSSAPVTCTRQVVINPQTAVVAPSTTTTQLGTSGSTYYVTQPTTPETTVPVSTVPAAATPTSTGSYGSCGQLSASQGVNSSGQSTTNFTASTAANGAALNGATFYFGDGSLQSVTPGSNGVASASHTYTTPGTYTVNVYFGFESPSGNFTTSYPCSMEVNVS